MYPVTEKTVLTRRADGSFVLDGLFHVPNEGEWAEQWAELNAHWEAHPERFGEEAADPEPTLEEAKAAKLAAIDAETSQTIMAGFEYEADGVTYHFSYDFFDQQNFADTANVCALKLQGTPGLPEVVTWNAYRVPEGELARLTFDARAFLALYTGGALTHKNAAMQKGGQRKSAVEAATTLEEVEAA